jgi:hypothetical protein
MLDSLHLPSGGRVIWHPETRIVEYQLPPGSSNKWLKRKNRGAHFANNRPSDSCKAKQPRRSLPSVRHQSKLWAKQKNAGNDRISPA